MSITHEHTYKWQLSGGPSIEKTVSKSAGAEVNLDEPVASSQTDYPINVAIDVSELKALYLVSDQDCVVETNSGSVPDDTINLEANVPVVWAKPASGTKPVCPLTVDVTKFYVTNTAALTLKLRCLVDPTP